MDKLKKIIGDHPVATSAAVTLAIVWAYHNGHLNGLFATPAKFVLVEKTDATAAAVAKAEA